jgi:hypothetical protein
MSAHRTAARRSPGPPKSWLGGRGLRFETVPSREVWSWFNKIGADPRFGPFSLRTPTRAIPYYVLPYSRFCTLRRSTTASFVCAQGCSSSWHAPYFIYREGIAVSSALVYMVCSAVQSIGLWVVLGGIRFRQPKFKTRILKVHVYGGKNENAVSVRGSLLSDIPSTTPSG